MISNKPSRCVAEWVDADSAPFVYSALDPVVQNNRQKKIRYMFEVFNSDQIFDILVLEKRIRIPTDHVISSSKELGKCAYCKWHDSFSHNTCECNISRRQLQSDIDEGRLKFRGHLNTRGQISHRQIFPKGVIDLEGKKILIRPSQAETTKDKNVIIGESREKIRLTIKSQSPRLMSFQLNIRKTMLTLKIEKI
jgi:hypothetical protein